MHFNALLILQREIIRRCGIPMTFRCQKYGAIIAKEPPQHCFTTVVSEANTPPTPFTCVVNRASTTHDKTREQAKINNLGQL